MIAESRAPSIDLLLTLNAIPGNHVFLLPDAPTFTIVGATNSFLRTSFKSREQIIGKPLFEVFTDNTADNKATGVSNLRASLNHVLDHKEPHFMADQRFDIVNPHTGAFEFKVWAASNEPVLDSEGVIKYIIHTTTDLTEKMRLLEESAAKEEKLHESENRFRRMVEQAPVAILLSRGEDVVIESTNEPMLRFMNKTLVEEVLNKKMLEVLPELEGQPALQVVKNVQKTGIPFNGDEQPVDLLIKGQLKRHFFNFSYTPIIEAGIVTGVLHVAIDITPQVEARKKAEESEKRYRTLVAEAVIATAVYTGKEIRIQYANEAMLKLWGKDNTVIGKTIKDALPELEGQALHELLDDVYTTGETYWGKEDKAEIEVNGMLQTFYFDFSYKAIRNAEGQIYGILNMASDVTDQILAQRRLQENEANLQRVVEERTNELQRKNEELEYTNEELQQFSYVAAHDLQEPLRKIRMYSDIMLSKVEPEAPVRQYVDKINTSAERMSGLINSLLEYTRLAKGGQRFEKVDLNNILQDVLCDYELLIKQKKASIVVDKMPSLYAIPLQINQLFYNLIGNALKFTRRNVQPAISIRGELLTDSEMESINPLDRKKEYVKLIVQDNGIGFEQNYASQIFSIFQRLNNKTAFGGYGIGLALCKKVTDTHKGMIFAEGKLNEGAKFTVILPVKQ